MCFSATGSFVLSGVLTGVGAAVMARNSFRSHRLFAAVPLVFAGQQAAEGIVWLTIDHPASSLHRLAVNTFLGVALVLWPMLLPLALQLMERNATRRRALTGLFWFGGAVALYATFLLTRWGPVAHVAGHSIRYDYVLSGDTALHPLYLLAYIVPTVVPFFVSTMNLARTMGAMLIVSLVVTVLVQRDALTSVWCFFAAVLSGLLFVAIGREQRSMAGSPVPSTS